MGTRARLVALGVVCLLAVAGCAGGSTSRDADRSSSRALPSTSATRLPPIPRIPDDFPLTAGWPAGGSTPQLRWSLDLPWCGRTAPPNPQGTDRLTVTRWKGLARRRQLTTYDDTAEATAVRRRVLAYYRACPAVELSPEIPWRTVTSVRPVALGDESWAVTRSTPTTGGGEVLLVVQVGRALLVDWSSLRDRAGAPPAAEAATQVRRQDHRAAPVIEAICALVGEGC